MNRQQRRQAQREAEREHRQPPPSDEPNRAARRQFVAGLPRAARFAVKAHRDGERVEGR